MRKLTAFICMALLVFPQYSFAGHLNDKNVLKEEFHVSKADQKKAEMIRKNTTLRDEEIYRLFNLGMSPEDIYICYTLQAITAKELKEIVQLYQDEGNDIALVLKDFDVPAEEFDKKFRELFPEELAEDSSRSVPWLRAPMS